MSPSFRLIVFFRHLRACKATSMGMPCDVTKFPFNLSFRFICNSDYKDDSFFAAAPPLEALRFLISWTATGRRHGLGGRKILLIDARKAHLHAFVDRDLFVELPKERYREGFCAKLRRCLYGTRDAGARWGQFYSEELRKLGFEKGGASPCCFTLRARNLCCVVHGDDFILSGSDGDLAWIEETFHAAFLMKTVGKLGGDAGDSQELRILNRILTWSKDGIGYEADPRHLEILIRDMQVDTSSTRPPVTPGVKQTATEIEEDQPLTSAESSQYRSWAARCNYLALDRCDVGYATKELCRHMSMPTQRNMRALRRVVLYLYSARWLKYVYRWQSGGQRLRVFADTDFAGCLITRKSTSGGVALHGGHLIKHWASTQRTVTLSSAEAELGGLVKAAAEGLGLKSVARDLGIMVELELFADAAAAIGICRRNGIGRIRHLAVAQLWVQEKLRDKELTLHKVAGESNPADLLTKHVSSEVLARLLHILPLEWSSTRAAGAPTITARE